MNQELLQAIKRRKKQMGGVDQPEEKPIPKSQINVQHNTEGFKQNKAMLENLFGKKHQPEIAPVQIKKEEIKGDAKNFNNAKALLQKNFGKGGANTNVMNVQPTGGFANLPPPPPPPSLPIGNLPLPPPPPSLNLNNLPPPPPSLNLPPPPPLLPNINLPPPPLNNLPPPPPLNIPQAPTNLLPPPPLIIPQVPKSIIQPSPPLNIQNPPPSIPSIPKSSIHVNQTKPQVNISFKSHIPTQQNVKPVPPPPNNIPNNIDSFVTNSTKQQEDAFFILSSGTGKPKTAHKQPNIPIVAAWDQKQLQKSKRRKIFDKKNPKKFPLTQQFLGVNLAALIKQEFVKTVNIPSIIGIQVKKKTYQINFPTIQNRLRAIQPIQTLYADTESLDLVSCFMNKNLNAAKEHNKKRDEFIANLNNYNWQTDPMKLKPVKQAAQILPVSSFIQPNFVAIKNATLRCKDLIKSLADNQQYARCDQLNKLIVQTDNRLKQYCSNPAQNKRLLDLIEQNVHAMKNVSI